MLLLATGGEPPYHEAFVADPDRLAELGAALEALRSARDFRPIQAFFARYESAHRAAERGLALTISRRKWQARRLEVRDLLGRDLGARGRELDGDSVEVRKLGWVQLDKELGRARALLRIGAPSTVVDGQRERVRRAFLATGWNDRHAPEPAAPPELEFWSWPVRAQASGEIVIGDLDGPSSEQLGWGRAQELVERGLELCIPPLAEPAGLGGHGSLDAEGTPLVSPASAAHRGWVDPSWAPLFRVGREALGIEARVRARPEAIPEALERRQARLAEAARLAAERGLALVWWLDPAV